ncbi:HNH endonuclease [uncultured Bacteroides sp.]|uniref:HNH endonuclease n=1 Tax=uncultured Bacteroides sp. TaxID=162156 RepID=UPI00262E0325|nr:HNH endonuclease [uncultured Bacteroides sp.]
MEEKYKINSGNDNIKIYYVSHESNANSHCKIICPERKECPYFLNELRKDTISTEFYLYTIFIIVENITSKNIDIKYTNFKAIDEDGFTHSAVELCDKYSFDYISENYSIPEFSKIKMALLFSNVESEIVKIHYSDYDNNLILDLTSKANNETPEIAYQRIIKDLNEQIECLRNNLKEEENKYEDLRKKYFSKENQIPEESKPLSQRMKESTLVRYKIVEDDDYWRIFSLEEFDTLSFNREFDKSKSNHNWVNVNDPLITMKVDNTIWGMHAPTIIKSPVSGIFESDTNKMIRFNNEICRIRKYPQNQKEEIIEQLEREEIKQAVLFKERKKMIERETLDELISEGKVFNVYTKKDGNRTTIPLDIANAVWNRDGGKCCICGSKEDLEFDHIIPLSKGGATSFRNLQLLCRKCNNIKSDNI